MKNNRFKLEQNTRQDNWWVLTDTESLIVIQFEEHKFNESQKVTILEESQFFEKEDCANELAHIMAEMGDYMYSHWYSIALPTPVYEFRQDDEQDRFLLLRNKFPKLAIEIQDDCDLKTLSDALKKAGEFVLKFNRKK